MSATDAPARAASPYRLFDVQVRRIARLSPSFARFTFSGADLDRFADNGYDQRIKLVLPLPGLAALPSGDDWFQQWRALPDERRCPIRTYTARAVRRQSREVDVDVVLHGELGPASRWATHAAPGDRIMLLGPNAGFDGDTGGTEFLPSAWARPLLIAADETAVPAVAAILERLPAAARGQVLLEVPTAEDVLDLVAPPGMTITWLARTGGAHGDRLVPAVAAAASRVTGSSVAGSSVPPTPADLDDQGDGTDAGTDLLWEVPQPGAGPTSGPETDVYAWLAGEAGVITTLRRYLVRELGVDRRSVAFMGYWKLGRAES